MRTRKTPYLDAFHAVNATLNIDEKHTLQIKRPLLIIPVKKICTQCFTITQLVFSNARLAQTEIFVSFQKKILNARKISFLVFYKRL